MTGAGVSRWNAAPAPPLGIAAQPPEPGRDAFYEHLLHVCLLLLLHESAAASAQLRERLRPLGFEQVTTALEATLDVLAATGLVQSSLEHSADGRRIRVYSVTADGATWLRTATMDLRRTEVVLGGFLARCGERLLSLT
ncbi:MAG TPA: hypothetical protein VNT54_14595 [Solirubrobacteraceae bacterium]|nr:hypothetical protein [Solirubrobacteraceae bacterium]